MKVHTSISHYTQIHQSIITPQTQTSNPVTFLLMVPHLFILHIIAAFCFLHGSPGIYCCSKLLLLLYFLDLVKALWRWLPEMMLLLRPHKKSFTSYPSCLDTHLYPAAFYTACTLYISNLRYPLSKLPLIVLIKLI